MSYTREYTLLDRPRPVVRISEAAHQPQPPSDPHYPDTTRQPIGREERLKLILAFKVAFDLVTAGRQGLMPGRNKKERMDAWRHEQVTIATEGRASGLSTLMRSDWRNVYGRLLHLTGLDVAAFELLLRTGATKSGEAVETVEQCDKWIAGMLAKVKKHFATQGGNAQARTEAWLQSIVQHKEAKYEKPWRQWEVKQRTELYWTLKNRHAALVGDGETAHRNKSQRHKRSAALPSGEPCEPSQLALFGERPF